jgi:hypothetical protein
MEGGLATCRSPWLLQSRKNPRKDFFWRPTRDWRGARSALRSNGAGGRNPGKPVKNGLLADFSQGMNGGADKGSVQNNSGNIYTVGFELCSY